MERVVVGVEMGGDEALLEETFELMFLVGDSGFAGPGRDTEHRGVGAAVFWAVDANEGVKRADRTPGGVRSGGQRDGLDALGVLDGLGFADREDETFLGTADVAPGENLLEINALPGGRKEVAGPEHT